MRPPNWTVISALSALEAAAARYGSQHPSLSAQREARLLLVQTALSFADAMPRIPRKRRAEVAATIPLRGAK